MTVGISVPLPAYTFDPAIITKKAEDLGFDSIWYAEHPAVPVESVSTFPATGGEIPWTYSHFSDPYIALARASAVTPSNWRPASHWCPNAIRCSSRKKYPFSTYTAAGASSSGSVPAG